MTVPFVRVGVSGTGFIARSLVQVLARNHPGLRPSCVLTRRHPDAVGGFPMPDLLTRSIDDLVDRADVVVECSGDVAQATLVVERAMLARKPVVTMDAEFHVTVGSHFAGSGWLSEAEGDQPGCLAALAEEMRAMGFRPLAYGNMKGFLDRTPTPESMRHWAERQGISLNQVTSFTDGTKIQIEQALVANGLGATILQRGLAGWARDDTDQAARELGEAAIAHGAPIADYLLSRSQYAGVFVTATHDDEQAVALKYFKLGDGPLYVLYKRNHLCSLEVPKTLLRAVRGDTPLLNNSTAPTVGVVAVAKRVLEPGDTIARAIGGFDVRGEAILLNAAAAHPPIGVLDGARVLRRIEPGDTLRWDDVEPLPTRALELCTPRHGAGRAGTDEGVGPTRPSARV